MKKILLIITLAALCAAKTFAAPLGTGFTYQGRLNDGGAPANGSYDLLFMLYDHPTDTLSFGEYIVLSAVPVTNGYFTVQLNTNGEFGPLAFTGEARWLQIGVRSNPSANWTFLAPRQPLTPTPYALMARSVPDGAITSGKIANGAIGAQQIAIGGISTSNLAAGTITSEKLAPGSAEANLLAGGQSPVGSGGVIFSEFANATNLIDAGYSKLTLQPVDLPTEKWTKHADAPALPGVLQGMRRNRHTTIWTGKEWIIWGGVGFDANGPVNTGARYNPSNGVWAVVNTNNAPSPRSDHTAIWTGTEMIIWGGSAEVNTGGRYNPATDTWTPLPIAGAPSGRRLHHAVWTGTQMIIWGGLTLDVPLNSGARYTPANNTWSVITAAGAPSFYEGSKAVWAGNYLTLWGGWTNIVEDQVVYTVAVQGGARYNPANNTWLPVTTNNAPKPRYLHTAVSSGSEMIVWGGKYAFYELDDGATYDPVTDIWTSWLTPSTYPRVGAQAVWSGSEMIIFGGHWDSGWGTHHFSDGLRYRPSTHTWSQVATNLGFSAPDGFTMTWGGSQMLLWGGDSNTGRLYNPTNNTWSTTTPGPSGDTTERTQETTVWTGKEMILWGGANREGVLLRSGLAYNPATKAWRVLNVTGAPSARKGHTAVWTGTEMIVFGGVTAAGPSNGGARYNPVTDSWIPLPANSAPNARQQHTAVWTGKDMVVWGGIAGFSLVGDGARFNLAGNAWAPISTNNAPSARYLHTAVWTGTDMIVWGGANDWFSFPDSGARYNPANNTWTPISTSNAPLGRTGHTATWTGSEMLIWGGIAFDSVNTGSRYNPVTDQWTAMSIFGAPTVASTATAFTGNKFLVWGGLNIYSSAVNTGAAYDLESNLWTPTLATNSFAVPMPSGRYSHAACWTGTEMLI